MWIFPCYWILYRNYHDLFFGWGLSLHTFKENIHITIICICSNFGDSILFRFLRKTTCVRFGKAVAHPQLAWESQLPLKPCLSLQPSDFEGNCDSSDSLLDFCFFSSCSLICSANVGYSPTPRQHFWKTAAPKNFLFACGSYPATNFTSFYFPCFPLFLWNGE